MSLNTQSVEDALRKLKSYQLQIRTRTTQAMSQLMSDAKVVLEAYISAAYVHDVDDKDHDVKVTLDENDGVYTLTATGDPIGFIEFGTGAHVDEQHAFREEAPFPVFSGSFSDTVGKGTWQYWIRAGRKPEDYPYNRYPTYPLYNTSLWIRDHATEYLKRALKGIEI